MEIATKIAPLGLALIMLGLGLSLTIQDFIRVVKIPKDFLVGFICQLCFSTNCCICSIALIIKPTPQNLLWSNDNCMCAWWCYIKCTY